MIESTNQIANYSRYHIREICATVRLLSSEQKQRLLEEIQLLKGTCSLMEQEYNQKICEYIESLLNGKRAKK